MRSPERLSRLRTDKRYWFIAALVALSVVLATSLLTALMSSPLFDDAVDIRLDSHRVWSLDGSTAGARRVTMAIAPVVNPRESYRAWGRLAGYLERQTSIPITVVHRRRYAEINRMLTADEAQIALICSGPYVKLRQQGIVKLLVVPKVRGAVTYRSLIVARADSGISTMADLGGKSFAFSDPLSNSGYLYPAFVLHQIGQTPASYFSRTMFSYGHERTMLTVARRYADGAAVDSLVWDGWRDEKPDIVGQLRVVQQSPLFGINPIVVGRKTPADIEQALRRALLTMHDDDEGHRILGELNIDSFVPGDPKSYAGIEQMLDAIGG